MNRSSGIYQFRKSGFLEKRSGLKRQWKYYWCVLDGGQLFYSHDKNGPIKAGIDLSQAKVIKVDRGISRGYCFVINCTLKKFIFSCSQQAECTEWINILKEAMEFSAPSTKKKTPPLTRDASVSDDIDDLPYYEGVSEENLTAVSESNENDDIYEDVDQDSVFKRESIKKDQTRNVNPRGPSLYEGDDPGYDTFQKEETSRIINPRGSSLYGGEDPGYDTTELVRSPGPSSLQNENDEEDMYQTIKSEPDPEPVVLLRKNSKTAMRNSNNVDSYNTVIPEGNKVLMSHNSAASTTTLVGDHDTYVEVNTLPTSVLPSHSSSASGTNTNSLTSVSDLSDSESFMEDPRKVIDLLLEFKRSEIESLVKTEVNDNSCINELRQLTESSKMSSGYSAPRRTCFGSNIESLRQYMSRSKVGET